MRQDVLDGPFASGDVLTNLFLAHSADGLVQRNASRAHALQEVLLAHPATLHLSGELLYPCLIRRMMEKFVSPGPMSRCGGASLPLLFGAYAAVAWVSSTVRAPSSIRCSLRGPK